MPVLKKVIALAAVVGATTAASPRDTLSRARQLYNEASYDAAIEAARGMTNAPALADAVQLVLARAYLERFRVSANDSDKIAAREALKQVRPAALSADDRVELTIALGESLYFDGEA